MHISLKKMPLWYRVSPRSMTRRGHTVSPMPWSLGQGLFRPSTTSFCLTSLTGLDPHFEGLLIAPAVVLVDQLSEQSIFFWETVAWVRRSFWRVWDNSGIAVWGRSTHIRLNGIGR